MRNCVFGFVLLAMAVFPMDASAQLRATQYVTGLSAPIAFIQDPADTANQYVVQQGGRIRLVRNGTLQPTDFLNLSGVISAGGERGLLGMALAPDYAASGRFFVYFTSNGDISGSANGDLVIARFKRSTDNPLIADPATRFNLRWSTGERFIQHRINTNHNGGNLAFGPDGFLYIGTGDGGSGNDPDNNAQNMGSLLGKMLRIDVSVGDGDQNGFVVPADNPFIGSNRPEIWSVGLRNPWRWSFDDPARGGTGALIIGDVGQGAREEINYEPAGRGGRNYGWRIREGTIATPGVPATTPAFTPLTDPIFDYGRSSGASITGGFVYRGSALPSFAGRYFYGDFVSGRIWSLALTINPTTGEATASNLQDHTSQLGSSSVSTFGVDANGELYFANYSNGRIYRIESSEPAMTVDRPVLTFGAITSGSGFSSQTPTQTVRLTQTGTGTVTWMASSNQPWLVVSPASGSGSGAFSVAVQFVSGLAASQAGTITLTFTGASSSSAPVQVTLNTFAAGSSAAPSGFFDTPADNSTGVNGSIGVTGWALDDVAVTRVGIWRDPVLGEQPGTLIFIGNAVLVEGARPDVQAAFPTAPNASRAGWGYLMLTNFLPNLGNGIVRLHAIAEDGDGHAVTLGTKTITTNNSSATTPFGAIDTPGQGEVVSGVVNNFGWVLSPGPRRADPPGGGLVQVVIDGAIAAFVPTGWTSRSDLSALFPAAQYPGINTALGVSTFDTTMLTNGVHTIAWLVTDNMGTASGIGSRYFTVSNGAGITAASSRLPASSARVAAEIAEPVLRIIGRRGFDPYGAYETFEPGADGRITIAIPAMGRVELWLATGSTALAVVNGVRTALPIGSQFNADTGQFTWSPGVGFNGAYDFLLAGRAVRIVVGGR